MKFFLTAPPGVGKSTIMDAVVKQFAPHCHGIVARELVDESGERTGFTAVNAHGQSRQFMFKTDTPSAESIANLFDVDISAIDEFVVPELRKGLHEHHGLTYIDEIGRAQMKSREFLGVVRSLLKTENNILATIVYDDEPESLEFKRAESVFILEVTYENRDWLPRILTAAFNQSALYNRLEAYQQRRVLDLLQKFLGENFYVSAEKIFTNAIGYVVDEKLKISNRSGAYMQYEVAGQTNNHQISSLDGGRTFTCDCDLSNGRGQFKDRPQTCSHEISILLSQAAAASI